MKYPTLFFHSTKSFTYETSSGRIEKKCLLPPDNGNELQRRTLLEQTSQLVRRWLETNLQCEIIGFLYLLCPWFCAISFHSWLTNAKNTRRRSSGRHWKSSMIAGLSFSFTLGRSTVSNAFIRRSGSRYLNKNDEIVKFKYFTYFQIDACSCGRDWLAYHLTVFTNASSFTSPIDPDLVNFRCFKREYWHSFTATK